MASDRLLIGLETSFSHDLPNTLEKVYEEKLNLLIAPLFHPRFKRDDIQVSDARLGPQTRSDLVLDSRGWTSSIVGGISKWINLDSSCPRVLSSSEKVFKQEIAWATHLSVPAVLLPTPQIQCFNYGRVLNQSVLNAQYLQFWVRIPLTYRTHSTAGHHQMEMPTTPDTRTSTSVGSIDTKDDSTICTTSPWEAWNHLRSMCEYHPKIQVALELTGDLSSHEELQRWLGEPIKAVILPTDIFLTNRKGFPTLSQMHQRFLLKLFQFQKIQYFFKGKARHCHENSTGHFLPYIQYLHFLYGKRQQMDTKAFFEAPYLDYLQAPLQPLMDNLESQTYETFEQDSCKYQQYELAITKALLKKNISCIEKKTVVMVVGAGRGPLVRCALRAAKNSNRKIKMYAIEKNPNAVITLRNMKISEKWDNVTIISSDMRLWKATEKADIMVSELLGSFGDNELSPECLDGAQAFLKEDGISIPCSYTSYVAPISSSKVWNEVKLHDTLKSFETPYVVRLHNFFSIAESQPCFRFDHPKFHPSQHEEKKKNRRYTKLSFVAKETSIIHGFGGYFDTVLFDDVMLSINPATHSEGMFSWFPIFFPLRQPTRIQRGQKLDVFFWRMVNEQKVWYEWTLKIENQTIAPIHNPNGRSYWIGL